MDLRSALADLPSESGKRRMIAEVANSRMNFDQLLDLCIHEQDPLAWRAAWVADGSDEEWPGLGRHALPRIINALPGMESTGTIRCLLRMLSRYEVPEEEQGILIDECFSYLVSDRYPVAVKAHAMEIIFRHVIIYPEMKAELASVITDHMDNNSAGFRSRGRRILNQLKEI